MCVPSLPTRPGMLAEALESVAHQTLQATEICVALDTGRRGAAVTRQRALDMASCDWVAFLDDDDKMLPQHLRVLANCAETNGADYCFSYFVRAQGGDPLGVFGVPFDPANPHQTTTTILVKRALAVQVGFPRPEGLYDKGRLFSGEDWRFTMECIRAGAKIMHVAEETWIWRRHGRNTSGIPGKGDAPK